MNKFAPVQNYIDVRNPQILWYCIPGFNGYELSNIGIVRSMKHHRKYPFGMIIKPKEVGDVIELFTKQFSELTYELTNNNNERKIVTRTQLNQLVANNPYSTNPRSTIERDIGSRNISCFINKS